MALTEKTHKSNCTAQNPDILMIIFQKSNEDPVTTVKTEIRIQTLPNDDPKPTEKKVKKPINPRKSGKKELDDPSKNIIDMHKT